MAEISLVNVSKNFGSVNVIDALSLDIKNGEFVVFLGPSGSGKSTLLRMIAGLEQIDGGTIEIGGERVDELPPGQRKVAMVFQNYALYPHMNVRQNMAFGLENIKMSSEEISRRVNEAARILEIDELLDRKPAQMSGGQRQRVAIGRAIVKEPEAFLFDEPLSNLDAALRVRTRVELAELHQRVNATMIYVTHDQTEAMTLADRILVLNNQNIEQLGTPMEIYTRPASRFVASFVGSPAMNFLPIEIKGKKKLTAILGDGASFSIPVKLPETTSRTNVELGIRPEFVSISRDGNAMTSGKITVAEQLGERTLIHVKLADNSTLIAQDIGNSSLKAGDTVGLNFDLSATHLFDEKGKAYHCN